MTAFATALQAIVDCFGISVGREGGSGVTITWLLCRSAEGAMVSGPRVCPLLSKGSVCLVFRVGVENLLKVPAWARRRGEIAISRKIFHGIRPPTLTVDVPHSIGTIFYDNWHLHPPNKKDFLLLPANSLLKGKFPSLLSCNMIGESVGKFVRNCDDACHLHVLVIGS